MGSRVSYVFRISVKSNNDCSFRPEQSPISNSYPNPHLTSSYILEAEEKATAAPHAPEHSIRLTEGDCRKAVMELLDNDVLSNDH